MDVVVCLFGKIFENKLKKNKVIDMMVFIFEI